MFSSLCKAEGNKYIPLVVFGVTSLVAGLCTFLLPETTGTNLPESLEDGENIK